jgi:hypothetical protein
MARHRTLNYLQAILQAYLHHYAELQLEWIRDVPQKCQTCQMLLQRRAAPLTRCVISQTQCQVLRQPKHKISLNIMYYQDF